jgi:subfamily B ATP-binding cassette protein MsbA
MLLLTPPLKRLTGVAEHLQRGLAAAESVFALLDEKPENDEGRITLARARGDIDFHDVSFRYPRADTPALDSVP